MNFLSNLEKHAVAKQFVLPIVSGKLTRDPENKNFNNFCVGSNNQIHFKPVNSGMSQKRCNYHNKSNHFVINNDTNFFTSINNIDNVLLHMTDVYKEALVKKKTFNPFNFMLILEKEKVEEGYYKGDAQLAFSQYSLQSNATQVFNYSFNDYLDHFIGWNFGVSVNRDVNLKNSIHELNESLIKKGRRKHAGTGFEVFGTTDKAQNFIQHVDIPTTL